VWTNLDCDFCTRRRRRVDTIRNWDLDVRLPPSPSVRVVPGDHSVRVEWDNAPEQMINAAVVGSSDFRLRRLQGSTGTTIRHREFRAARARALAAARVYRADPSQGGLPLANIIDPTLPPMARAPVGPHYPVGRYHIEGRPRAQRLSIITTW
jgi:hypothetical protein